MKKFKNTIRHLQELEAKSNENYDRALLTLSAGSIALSVTFIKNISNINTDAISTLQLSWTFLTTTIIGVLCSFVTSQIALRTAVRKLKNIKEGEEVPNIFGFYHCLTILINAISGISFIIGIILFLSFSYSTVGVNQMDKKSEVTNKRPTVEEVVEVTVNKLKEKGFIVSEEIEDDDEQPKNK